MEREIQMEHESMRERKGAGTILRAGAAMALVAALAACGGGGDGDMGANQNTEMSGTPTLAERISAANAAAVALTNESDSDAVENARGLITAAQEAIDALPGTEQEAQDSQLVGAIRLVMRQEERVEDEEELDEAISMATTAVGNLTDESNEAAVMAARVLVTAAQDLGADEEALADSIADLKKQEDRVTTGKSIATALGKANDAAGDLSDTSDADAVANARALIRTASTTGATGAQLASAEAAVSKHERRLDLATARAAISAAGTAVGAVKDNSEIGVVETAEGNIQTARKRVMDLKHLTEDDRELLNGEIATIEGILTESKKDRDTAIAARNAEDAKARTADAKALMGALKVAPPSGGVTPTMISQGMSGAATSPAIANLEKTSATVAALAGWQGAHYEGRAPASGTLTHTGETRVYSNQGMAGTQAFSARYGGPVSAMKHYTLAESANNSTGQLAWGNDRVSGGDFGTSGRKTFEGPQSFRGSYDGAAGLYQCSGSCTADVNKDGEVTALSNLWRFTPDEGAMVPKAAAAHLQFGWWVRKDKDGKPVDAGAFSRDSDGSVSGIAPIDATAPIGGATYRGGAAGKFAISNGARPAEDSSGHFTADATLEADFDDNKLSGTINNFTLNDTTKGPWVVSLEEQALVQAGIERGSEETASKTKWSLDGTNFGAAGGGWDAAFYEDEDDGNSIPDSVIGSFEAGIGGTHHLEGAFGASQQ